MKRTDDCLKQGNNSPKSGRESLKTLVNQRKTAPMALRDQEAAGSNPVTPMRKPAKTLSFGGLLIFAFSSLTTGFTINRSTFGETVFLFCSALDLNGRMGSAQSLPGEALLCFLRGRFCLSVVFAASLCRYGDPSHPISPDAGLMRGAGDGFGICRDQFPCLSNASMMP